MNRQKKKKKRKIQTRLFLHSRAWAAGRALVDKILPNPVKSALRQRARLIYGVSFPRRRTFFSRHAVAVNRQLKNGSLGSRTCRHYSSCSHVYEHLLWWKRRMINKWTHIKSAAFGPRRLVALAAATSSYSTSYSGLRWKSKRKMQSAKKMK